MVRINRIYTRSGDDGETHLTGGRRVPKDSLRIETIGEVDELNSFLGLARTLADELKRTGLADRLRLVQNQLFDLGACLACHPEAAPRSITGADIERLEKWIDEYNQALPELRSFVLPGGSRMNALLHLARAVCRRAERAAVRLGRSDKTAPEPAIFLNRLSDLLFVMARHDAAENKTREYLWE